MKLIMVVAGWAFLILAVTLTASGIAHGTTYIFTRRKMARAWVLLVSLSALLVLIFAIISFQV